MSVDNEFKLAEGVYAVPRKDGKSVFIGIHPEDLGKLEGGELSSELQPIRENMYGLVAGKTEGSELFAATVWRELREETGLEKPIHAITNTLPPVTIYQQRPEGKVAFIVHGHRFDVTQADISQINLHSPTWEVSDDELLRFAQEEKDSLRPSVYIMLLKLIFEHLEQGGRI